MVKRQQREAIIASKNLLASPPTSMFRLCCRPTKTDTSNALSVVELLVQMDCDACEKRVRRAISKMDGVDSVEVDMDLQKVTVTGYVDQMEVLEVVRGRRRKAEFWQYDEDRDESTTFSATYNYYCHGYNNQFSNTNNEYNLNTTLSDHAVFVFSDDNPHAYCTIM